MVHPANRTPSSRRTSWVHALIGVLLCAGMGAAVYFDATPPSLPPRTPTPITAPPPRGDSVIFVVVDTLRADHLGTYGYARQTSPFLDTVARQSIRFDRFYSSAPWTLPAFGSLLTGVSPSVHRSGRWYRTQLPGTVRIGSVNTYPLAPSLRTLWQMARRHGMTTAVFTSNPFVSAALGFARGVDHFVNNKNLDRAAPLTDAAAAWLRDNGHRPVAVLIHYMDPHTPYDPPPTYRRRFAPRLHGRIVAPFGPTAAKLAHFHPTEAEIASVQGLYDAEVRYVDDQLRRLWRTLEQTGLLRRAWIVVTADHGEEHWDHGDFNHGFQFEDEVVRIPFLLRPPGGRWGAGTVVPFSARMIDVLPTVADWMGWRLPWYVEGRSLMPLLNGREQDDRPCYMEYTLKRTPKVALFSGRFKIIKEEFGDDGYAYDIGMDPRERRRLGPDSAVYRSMARALRRHRHAVAQRRKLVIAREKGMSVRPTPELAPDVLEALRHLGYME